MQVLLCFIPFLIVIFTITIPIITIYLTKIKNIANKITKRDIIFFIIFFILSILLSYLIPYSSISSCIYQTYFFSVFRKWIITTIYAIKNYKDIEEGKLISLFIFSFIPMVTFFSQGFNTIKSNETIFCSLTWEPTVRPQEIRSNLGPFIYIESFNTLVGLFNRAVDTNGITQEDLRQLLNRTIIKIRRDDFHTTMDYHDLMVIKRMSLYSEYSRESRALLRGLSNPYLVTIRDNHASTA